jgi:hypothetical protein
MRLLPASTVPIYSRTLHPTQPHHRRRWSDGTKADLNLGQSRSNAGAKPTEKDGVDGSAAIRPQSRIVTKRLGNDLLNRDRVFNGEKGRLCTSGGATPHSRDSLTVSTITNVNTVFLASVVQSHLS